MFRLSPARRALSQTTIMSSATKRVLVPIGDGSEDLETATITDVLVRCGVDVTTCSVMPNGEAGVTMARGMKVTTGGNIAKILETADPSSAFDAIVFPGGMPGAQHLADCKPLIAFAKEMKKSGKTIAAICAAPVIALGPHGLLDGVKEATCFPMMKDKMVSGTTWLPNTVVVDGKTITSQGPATALAFSLQVAAHVVGSEQAAKVAGMMLVHDFAFLPSKQ